jgi:hypothetical protein
MKVTTSYPSTHKLESGQSIILIVFSMIALFGITALAIDGGRIYSDRRYSQNSADTASFAGALVIGEVELSDPLSLPASLITNALNAAYARTESNGYSNDDESVSVNAEVTGPYTDNGIYYLVKVDITSELTTTFSHLVFGGPLQGSVTSTAKARVRTNISYGYSMFGTSKDECKTIWFSGTSETTITGGGVFSNSNAKSQSCSSGVYGGSGNVTVSPGGISSVGSFTLSGSGTVSPNPSTGAPQVTVPHAPIPDCSGLTDYGDVQINGSGAVTIGPGKYDSIKVTSSPELTMESGMYCIMDNGFTANGGTITGSGVFIYLVGGDFDLGGNTVVNLYAASNLKDPSKNQWGGMLVYMAYDNTSQVIITGGSGTTYTGTIYAPEPASPSSKTKCKVTGTGDSIGLSSQLICYSIELTGNAIIDLNYDKNYNYRLPFVLDLLK